MLKHEIRTLFLQKRAGLSEQQKVDFNKKLTLLLLKQITESWKTIHIYLPIHSKNEIDTWPIIRQLWETEIEVVVPVMLETETKLRNCLLNKNTKLEGNKWNVLEPIQCKTIKNDQIDVVVLPLLAFDMKGFRVGYGKGYYDKFLAGLSKDVLTIGLSYFPPIDKINDVNPWDIPMDMCVTPEATFQF